MITCKDIEALAAEAAKLPPEGSVMGFVVHEGAVRYFMFRGPLDVVFVPSVVQYFQMGKGKK